MRFYVHDIITDDMVPFSTLNDALEYAYRIGCDVPGRHIYVKNGNRYTAFCN